MSGGQPGSFWEIPGNIGFKQGFLVKQGSRGLKTWKRKWYVLANDQLLSYDRPQDEKPTGMVSLADTQSVVEAADTDTSRPNCLKWVTNTRTYLFSAESRKDLEEWLHALRSVSYLFLRRWKQEDKSPCVENVREAGEFAYKLMAETYRSSLIGYLKEAQTHDAVSQFSKELGTQVIALAATAFAVSAKAAASKMPDKNSASMNKLHQAADSVREATVKLLNVVKTMKMSDEALRRQLVDYAAGVRDATAPLIITDEAKAAAQAPPADPPRPTLAQQQQQDSRHSLLRKSSVGVRVLARQAAEKPDDLALAVKEANELSSQLVEAVRQKQTGEPLVQGAKRAMDAVQTLMSLGADAARDTPSGTYSFQEHLEYLYDAIDDVRTTSETLVETAAAVQVARMQGSGDEEMASLEFNLTTLHSATDNIQEQTKAARHFIEACSLVSDDAEHAVSPAFLALLAGAQALLKVCADLESEFSEESGLGQRLREEHTTSLNKCVSEVGTHFSELQAFAKAVADAAATGGAAGPSPVDGLIKSVHKLSEALKSVEPTADACRVYVEGGMSSRLTMDAVMASSVAYQDLVESLSANLAASVVNLGGAASRPRSMTFDDTSDLPDDTVSMGARSVTASAVQLLESGNHIVKMDRPDRASEDVTTRAIFAQACEEVRTLSLAVLRSILAPSELSDVARRLSCAVAAMLNAARAIESGQTLDDETTGDDEPDVNIYEEAGPCDDNVVFMPEADENGTRPLKAGTLNKLVEQLTDENTINLAYLKTFIITYRSFTTPDLLFDKLVQRYDVPIPRLPPNITMEEFRRKTTQPVVMRVCNVVKAWVEDSFDDFDEMLVRKVEAFAETLEKDGQAALAKQLKNTLQKMQQKQAQTPAETQSVRAAKMPKNLEVGSLILLNDAAKIAEQMTREDWAIYVAIKPTELLNQAWSKPKYKHRAKNVLAMIERFNLVSQWVASNILWQETLRKRTQVMAKLIEVAGALRRLGNFNSLLAILSGFGNAAVHRLKHTKASLGKEQVKTLEQLEVLMNSQKSYKNFRDVLHSVNPPCIPYLGMYLTDLTFIDDGNPDFIQSPTKAKLINFYKRTLVVNVIHEVQQYQQTRYELANNNELEAFIQELPRMPEKEMYDMSLQREPRKADVADLK